MASHICINQEEGSLCCTLLEPSICEGSNRILRRLDVSRERLCACLMLHLWLNKHEGINFNSNRGRLKQDGWRERELVCVCVCAYMCVCVCVHVCSVCMCMYVSKTSNTVLCTYSHMYHTFLEDILIIICLCSEQTDHHARTLAVSHTHQLHINKYGLVSTVQPILLLLLTNDTYSCTHHRI